MDDVGVLLLRGLTPENNANAVSADFVSPWHARNAGGVPRALRAGPDWHAHPTGEPD